MPSSALNIARIYCDRLAMIERHIEIAKIHPYTDFLKFSRLHSQLVTNLDGLSLIYKNRLSTQLNSLVDYEGLRFFVETLLALEYADIAWLKRIFTQIETEPMAVESIISAFAYTEKKKLGGLLDSLLASNNYLEREVALRACVAHRLANASMLDEQLAWAVKYKHTEVIAWTFRLAGEVGIAVFAEKILEHVNVENPVVSSAAAYASALLGSGRSGLLALAKVVERTYPLLDEAILLILRAGDATACNQLIMMLAEQAKADNATVHNKRTFLLALGCSGDVRMVNWLFSAMEDHSAARLAGVAFSMITGADLAYLDLDQPPPADFEEGPNDDPDDDNIEMDSDTGAPWPNAEKVKAWYAQSGLAKMEGQRLLCGQPQSIKAALDTLRNGFQNQRRVAAYDLALLDPGKPLFHWYEDPAQQKIKMDALDARFGIKRENPYPYVSVFARM
jgi:uncharacterized protein (TIGR02270 family)